MQRNWIRYSVITLGSIILLLVLANFGLNFWLQNNLPEYIKKNTDYSIFYKDIDVDLGTGNIGIIGISIKNKNEKNDSILGLKGTIDSLEISRFGIYDAVFNNKISASRLKMINPNLEVILPDPSKKKDRKKTKRFEIPFRNLEITNGNIAIFKWNKNKLFSARDLTVNIQELKLAEKNSEQLLPITFDQENINGKNLYFRQGNLQIIKAEKIRTENELVNIKNLEIFPLLSYAQISKFYPEKGSFVKGTIGNITIKDFVLKKKSIDLKSLVVSNADIQLFTVKIAGKKEKKPFKFEVDLKDLQMKNSKVQIYNSVKNRIFSGRNLEVAVSDLLLNEETLKSKIPAKYKTFTISGTEVESVLGDQKMIFTKLNVNPKTILINDVLLSSIGNTSRKTNMNGNIKQVAINFNDYKFDEGKLDINIENILVNGANGNLNLFKRNKKKKPITGIEFPVLLNKLELKDSNLTINSNSKKVFSGRNLEVLFDKIAITEKSSKSKIPLEYKDFKITGNNVELATEHQNIMMQTVYVVPNSIQLTNLNLKPKSNFNTASAMDGRINNIKIKIKEWNFKNDLLKLNVDEVLIYGLNGKLNLAKSKNKATQKKPISGINFPLLVKNISLKKSNLDLYANNSPMTFKNLNANIQNFEMNAQTVKQKTPFKIGNYNLTASNFNYKINEFYHSKIRSISIDNNKINLRNVIVKPTVSRAEFVRRQPVEKDLYDLNVKQLTANGKWDFFSNQIIIDVKEVNFNGMDANIFRSKIPNDDLTVKPLYSSMLAGLKFPLFVENLNINNSRLVYEEDTKKSEGPGKLIFADFNLNAKNINSNKFPGRPTNIPIIIKTTMMESATLTVNWEFDTAKPDDYFTISGYTGDMPAPDLNRFTEPYLKVRTKGEISRLAFAFNGDKKTINGNFKMLHQDLKVEMLKKDGEKDKIVSAIANIFVKNDSGPNPPAIVIENVERDNTKSFFNFLWRGIEAGLKKTLLGLGSSAKKVETTEEFPDDKEEIEALKEMQSKPKKEKKKGFFKRLFQKKKAEK